MKKLLSILVFVFSINLVLALPLLDVKNNAELLYNYTAIIHSDPGSINVKLYSFPINTSSQIVKEIYTNMYRENDHYEYDGYTNGSLRINLLAVIQTKKPVIRNQALKPSIINNTYELSRDIVLLARQLSSQTLLETAGNINEWVHDNIQYVEEEPYISGFIPPAETIKTRKGVCDEMAALEVALLNALGINARVMKGIAYSNIHNDWVAHAWVTLNNFSMDPAYNEYGFLSPAHIALGYSDNDLLVEGKGSIKIDTQFNVKTLRITKAISIPATAYALFPKISDYSYEAIILNITNPYNSWIIDEVQLIAPTGVRIIDDKKIVVVQPHSSKQYRFLLQLRDLVPGFIYTYPVLLKGALIEANTSFKASNSYRYVSKKEVLSRNKEKKTVMELVCTNNIIHYSTQPVKIKCNTTLSQYKIVIPLNYSYKKKQNSLEIYLNITNPGKIGIPIELKSSVVASDYVQVITLPTSFKPKLIYAPINSWDTVINTTIILDPPGKLSYRDISLILDTPFNRYIFTTPTLSRETIIPLNLSNKDFYIGNNTLRITINYTDLLNHTHIERYNYSIYLYSSSIKDKAYGFLKKIIYWVNQKSFKD